MGFQNVPSEGLEVDYRYSDGMQVANTQKLPEVDLNQFSAQKEVASQQLNDFERTNEQSVCGIRKRWFWIALIGSITVLAAIIGGIVGGLTSKSRTSTTTSISATPTATGTGITVSSLPAIANSSKLAAVAFNDTKNILQYRVYYQDSSNNIRESAWNETGKEWYVSNPTVVSAKAGSPIAATATGLPGFSKTINLYTLNTSNLINEHILTNSSVWTPGGLNDANIQAAEDSNIGAISHAHPGCLSCDNSTVIVYEDSGTKLNVGRFEEADGRWTWATLPLGDEPLEGSGLSISLKWYPDSDQAKTGIRVYYQNASGVQWTRWDILENQTDPSFTDWFSGGSFPGSSEVSASIASFAYGTNTTTGLPVNIEILSSSSHGVTNYPWLGATSAGAFEDPKGPVVMESLNAYTPLAANGDGRVYGMQGTVIKEFAVSTDGKSTWRLIGDVVTK